MSSKKRYTLAFMEGQRDIVMNIPPSIEEVLDDDGVTWKEAKKQLRQWYLDQAKQLRKVNQKQYFQENK